MGVRERCSLEQSFQKYLVICIWGYLGNNLLWVCFALQEIAEGFIRLRFLGIFVILCGIFTAFRWGKCWKGIRNLKSIIEESHFLENQLCKNFSLFKSSYFWMFVFIKNEFLPIPVYIFHFLIAGSWPIIGNCTDQIGDDNQPIIIIPLWFLVENFWQGSLYNGFKRFISLHKLDQDHRFNNRCFRFDGLADDGLDG